MNDEILFIIAGSTEYIIRNCYITSTQFIDRKMQQLIKDT